VLGDAPKVVCRNMTNQVRDDIGVDNWVDSDTGSLAEEQRPCIEER
jgi:hypothetical protein